MQQWLNSSNPARSKENLACTFAFENCFFETKYDKIEPMELSEIRNKLEAHHQKVEDFRNALDLDRLEEEIALYDHDMSDPNFWNDSTAAQKVIDESNVLKA